MSNLVTIFKHNLAMKEVLEKAVAEELTPLETIIRLVYFIRPGRWQSIEDAESKLQDLIQILDQNPSLAAYLRNGISMLISQTKHIDLLAESGILTNAGFFTSAFLKISYKLFPPVPDRNELNECIGLVFDQSTDYKWLELVSFQTWDKLLSLLFPQDSIRTISQNLEKSFLDSILFISHRIAAMGIEPLLTTQIPTLENSSSPFVRLSAQVTKFLEAYKARQVSLEEGFAPILKGIDECEEELKFIKKVREEDGTSLSLTYISVRLQQNLQRMRMLIELVNPNDATQPYQHKVLSFFISSVKHENLRFKLRQHLNDNIELIAFQITDNAGKTGEHYITNSRKEYMGMLVSASKGGFVVAFLVMLKTMIYYMSLAPFGRAFLYSMNYSFGFIAVHLIHGTIATKQPAMTAAHIAASLDSKNNQSADIKGLSELVVKVFRSQFIAFVGNLGVVFPVSMIIAIVYFYISGGHLAGPEKSIHMIHEIHPFHSPALFHAAIAGVCLFVAGLISGYYDNIVRFRKIPERVENHPLLRKLMRKPRRQKIAHYLENNMGGLAGNFFLGIFLGSIGIVGAFFGWDVDIRHITFSTGNFAVALVGLDFKISLYDLIYTILGIIGIGIFNFSVSFGLALFVAIRSRGVNFKASRFLLGMVWKHFKTAPLDFIRPPKNAVDSTH